MNITEPTKKQTQWLKTNVDFEKSFKFWFALQWQNLYIQIFSLAFILLILQVINISDSLELILDSWHQSIGAGIMVTLYTLIPTSVCFIVAYKGFYQYYKNLSKS